MKKVKVLIIHNIISAFRSINGNVLELNKGLVKNASGYDLRHLFIGSEGTLGFITEVTVKLIDMPVPTKVLLFSIQNKNHFIEILNKFDADVKITAFEFFSQLALEQVLESCTLEHPFSEQSEFYILLEYESDLISDEAVLNISEQFINAEIISDALLSENIQQAKNLWRFREEISMSLRKHHPYKYDISVTPSRISDFMKDADELFQLYCPNFLIVWFGHLGDGNLHLNILCPKGAEPDDFFKSCENLSNHVYKLIQNYGGSIAAEHGVGLLKKEFLKFSKSEAEVQYMREIKNIFDKNGIMNPGKIYD